MSLPLSVAWRWGMAAWLAVVVIAARPATTGWINAMRAWGHASFTGTLGAGILLAPVQHLGLFVLAVLFAASYAGAGSVVRRFLPNPSTGRRPVGILLGFAAFGAWHLGLALAGVFDARVLGAGLIAALALSGARSLFAPLAGLERLRPPGGKAWWIVAFMAAIIPALGALVPDAHVDTLTYHLAIPEQILHAHKYTAEGAGLAHLFPLSAELNYAPAIALGAHALPHLIQLVPFLAAVALVAGRAAAAGGPAAGWLAVLLMVTFGETGRQLGIAKNDLAAAAYPMAAAVLLARVAEGARGWVLAAVLAGCGAAMKTSGGLTAAVLWIGVVIAVPRPGLPIRWLAIMAIPFVPWAVRSWLMTGDPVWPALSSRLPGALWDDASTEAMRLARGIADSPTRWRGLVGGLRGLAGEQPALILALPPAAWAAWKTAPGRLLLGWAAVSAAGFWVMMPGEWTRLSLGPLLVAGGVVAGALPALGASLPGSVRPWLLALGVACCWVPVGRTLAEGADPATTLKSLTGMLSPDAVLATRRSTLHEAGEAMRRLPDLRRVIGFGDIRGYRLPGRFLAERCFGRTHAWVYAGESRDADRIRVRFRQAGARHILYNFVTEAFPHPPAAPFTWEARRLNVWRTFVGRHLEIVVRPTHVDHANGGFVVYAIRSSPRPADPAWLPYLPGTESLYYEVTRFGLRGDLTGWLRAAEALDARVPHVDFIGDLKGVGYRLSSRWPEAYATYARGVGHGTINDSNYWDFAVCAFRLGRLEEAFHLFNRAIEISPYLKPDAEPAFAVIRQALARPDL